MGSNTEKFFKPDKLDWTCGTIVFGIVCFLLLGLSLFESIHWPLLIALLFYLIAVVSSTLKTKSLYRSSKIVLKAFIGRLGWFVTMAF
jgi:hypothetical protein